MWRFLSEGRDVSWVDMGWRLEHVTAGTTASSTKCKGTSQLAVGSTQGETVKEELINLHLLEEKASGLWIFHRLKIRRLDHVDPWEEEAGGGRGKLKPICLNPDSNLIIWIATQNISNDFQGCVCVVFLRVNGNPLKRRWQFKQVPINDIWHLLIQAHVKNAEKYLKTSPLKLKFTPDWDPAGDEFSRAATAFKVVIITTWVRWVGEMFTNWRKCFDLNVYDQSFQILIKMLMSKGCNFW